MFCCTQHLYVLILINIYKYKICSAHYCVFQVLGYICMVVYGLTALVSYRHWRIQYRLYQRRKLLEEDEIDL